MNFFSSPSARACLTDWNRPLTVEDILTLLLALRRTAATAGGPIISIVVVRAAVPVPANFLLTCIQGTLPALLECCEQLVVVIEGDGVDRSSLRAAFQSTRPTARRAAPLILASLEDAFAQAQRFAPHDVLELQRPVFSQNLSSERRRT